MDRQKLCLFSLLVLPLLALQGQECSNLGPNLFPGGDFGAGPDLADPDTAYIAPFWYAYALAPPLPASSYTITNNSAPWAAQPGGDWITVADNSPDPQGYMMLINGTSDATVFWEHTLNLCGDAYYLISLDAINLQHPDSALAPQPNIQVYTDGNLSGDFGLLPQDGQWHTFTKMISIAPGGGDILFELFNSNPGAAGNDFAVDNIALFRCGPQMEVRGNFEGPLCPGERVLFEVGIPPEFLGYWFQLQISTDGGQHWVNAGSPTDATTLILEDLPPNASFRLAMGANEAEANNFNCIVFSRQIDITYPDPAECSDAISSVGSPCAGELGANIFPNGDFGAGPDNILPVDPGYAPAYAYEFNPPPDDGTYTITNNTAPWGSFADGWIDIGDNSPDPEGYMMVVNAIEAPGLFFVDTVEVCENTTYEFSADIIAMNQPQFADFLVKPNISFLINGVAIFSTGNVPIDSSWHSYSFTFTTAAGVTELALGLRNNTPGGQGFIGNDLAIDNISLRPCGPEVSISESMAGPYCPGDAITFEASIGPGFDDFLIQWQYSTDGGATWQDTGAPSTASAYTIPFIPPNALIRALVAQTEAGLASENCRLASNVLQPALLDINDCFEFPVAIDGALCGGQYGENIFPEGDFGTGPAAFGPELPPGTSSLAFQDADWPNDGYYSLLNFWDQDICEGFFPVPCWILPITDNSEDPQGYGMVVNATQGETGIFYTATIDGLCEQATYRFSVDILNLNTRWFYPYNPNGTDTIILPNIDFIMGPAGAPFELMQIAPAVYNTGDILNDSTWNTYGFSFTTNPGVSAVTFALRNNAPGGGGNDFMLDNISFRMCGQAEISRAPSCIGDPATLQAIFDNGLFPAPAIQWQQSTDNGATWSDMPGETSPNLLLPAPVEGALFRYLLAAAQDNLDSTFCRLASAVDTIAFLPQPTSSAVGTICAGQSFEIGDSTFTRTGVYDVYFPAANGCDSIVTLGLQVLDTALLTFAAAICEGEAYPFQGNMLTAAGTFTEVLAAANGCDSTVILNLAVNPVYEFNLAETICEGASFFFEGQELSQPGDYEQAYLSGSGCDSIYRLSLAVLPILRDTVVGAICEGETYPFGNQALDMSGIYERTLAGSNGCDSVIILELTAHPVYEFNLDGTICEGESYLFEGQELSLPGDYQRQYLTATSCDSTYNLSLAVLPLAREAIAGEICEGESFPFGNQQLTVAGTYERAETGSNGCDSIITLELAAHPNVSLDIEAVICEGETYFFDGQELSAAGAYQASYSTQFGCDSTVNVSLAVLPILRDTLLAEICGGESYPFDGQSLSQPGLYEAIDTGSSGCDSITTLLLAVWPNEESMAFQSICQGESYAFGGQELTTAGAYQHTFATIHGCDSLVTLELEVLPVLAENLSAAICEGERYLFGGQELGQAGTYERVEVGSNGCDSTITLELAVLPVYSRQVDVELCRGDAFAGARIFSDTTIRFEGQTVAGCDSIITYAITVEDLSGFRIEGARPLCNDFTIALSAGSFAGYAWSTGSGLPELVVSLPGWYAVTVSSQRGCTAVDSVLIEEAGFVPEINALSPLCAGDDSGAISVAGIQGGSPPFLYSLDGGPFLDSSVFNGLLAGAYRLAIQDASGCEWAEAIQLTGPPPVSATISGVLGIALGDSTRLRVLSLGDSLVRFDWQPPTGLSCSDCPDPVARPGQSTTYIVTVEDANGCPGIFQVAVSVDGRLQLYAPNAFSPNDDGRNDFFALYPGKSVSRIISFQVFDRWGNKIFEGDDGGTGTPPQWDGTFKGERMNPAVFAWYAEVEFVDGASGLFEGEVFLLR